MARRCEATLAKQHLPPRASGESVDAPTKWTSPSKRENVHCCRTHSLKVNLIATTSVSSWTLRRHIRVPSIRVSSAGSPKQLSHQPVRPLLIYRHSSCAIPFSARHQDSRCREAPGATSTHIGTVDFIQFFLIIQRIIINNI